MRTTRTSKLREFFPCPKPAYGTVQRGSLVPVPDVLQYIDQLDEMNLLTARIHALSEALEVRASTLQAVPRSAMRCRPRSRDDAGQGAGADLKLGGVRRHQGGDHLVAD
jgi:hypothetical protein